MDEKLFDWLREDIISLKNDIKQVDDKVNQVLRFKWQIIGGSVVISMVLGVMVQIIIGN